METTHSSNSPLTLQNVEIALHHLIAGTCVKEAETALLHWETYQSNPYTYLLLCATVTPRVRLAALLTLKAVVSRLWKDRGRRRPQILLDESTKTQVRCVLVSLVTSGEHPLLNDGSIPLEYRNQFQVTSVIEDKTAQAAASSCLVQVARQDLPRNFQELIPCLVSSSAWSMESNKEPQTNHNLIFTKRRNALYALEAILEELAAKRLLGDKQYLAFVARTHLTSLSENGWVPALRLVLERRDSNSVSWEYAVLIVRTVHHLLRSALTSLLDQGDTPFDAVDRVFAVTLECSTPLLSNIGSDMDTEETGQELLKELWEMVLDVQQAHPIAFGRFLEPFLGLFYTILVGTTGTGCLQESRALLKYYSAQPQPKVLIPEHLIILALRFLASVVSCSYYVPDESKNEAVAQLQGKVQTERAISSKGDANLDLSTVQFSVHIVWNRFFTDERLCSLADLCVCRLVLLTPDRLSAWKENPEDYFLSELHRAADHDVGAAAQNLYCSLVESKSGQRVLPPRLIALLRDSEAQALAIEIKARGGVSCREAESEFADLSVLLWESIFTAAGLVAEVIEGCGDWNFFNWYRFCLAPVLSTIRQTRNESCSLPVLRRRIIWLIGCNTHRISRENAHPFKTLVDVILESSQQNDLVVRLSSVESMRSLLSNFDEATGECVPLAEVAINALFRLASECEQFESQSQVLECITLILSFIVGTGREISDEAANASVAPLPSLWNTVPLLRSDVLSILSFVASAVGRRQAEKLQPLALPMIDEALDPAYTSENTFLVPDALLLWLTLLRLGDSYNGHFAALFIRTKQVLEVDLKHLKLIMMITESNILIGGHAFLTDVSNRGTLEKLLQLSVGKVRLKGAMYVALVLEALLRGFPEEGGLLLLRGGILHTMLQSCEGNYREHKQCEPDGVIVIYLTAVSRILVRSPPLLASLHPLPLSFGLHELVQLFFRLFEQAGSDSANGCLRQKIWLLFLISSLPSSLDSSSALSAVVVESIDQLMNACLDFFSSNVGQGRMQPYTINYDSEEETVFPVFKEFQELLRVALSKDVGYTTDLMTFFKERMTSLSTVMGGEAYPQLLNEKVESVVLRRLEGILNE